MAALGAQVLHEMGFTNVTYMDSGMRGWKAEGLPTSE
jgi:rhodanese-related sulfurtransferase